MESGHRLGPTICRQSRITLAFIRPASRRSTKSSAGCGSGRWSTTVRCCCSNCSVRGCTRRRSSAPGFTLLERSVTVARQQAHEATWEMIAPLLSAEDRRHLDRLLVVDEQLGVTPLTRYRTAATSHSASAILKVLEKITQMRATG